MNPDPAKRPAAWAKLFAAYALLTLVLVLPSATLWFREPFEVLRHNFEWSCGLLQIEGWPPGYIMLLGRCISALLFVAMGVCFYRLAMRHADAIENTPSRTVWIATGVLLAIHLIALPWLNPDVFWSIGRGWVDAHYGLEPYIVPTNAIPHFSADPMFQNIDPPLLKNSGNYGPLHHTLATLLAGLSGGDIRLATLLFKLADLAMLIGSGVAIHRLARHYGLRAQHLTFCYLANPIVPLVLIAWGHNDGMQNLFVLLAILALVRKQPLLSGLALGAAIATKYVAIVLAPALLIYWLHQPRWNLRAPLLAAAGLLGIVAYTHTMYDGCWETTRRILAGGWSPVRSSLYCIVAVFMWLFEGKTFAPFRTASALIYVAAGAALTFACLWRRTVQPADFIKVTLWIFNFYFLFNAPAVLEWYLTWNLACLLLLPGYFRSFAALCSFYMILVPFTLYLPDLFQFPVNIVLYLFFAFCAVWLTPWWRREPQLLGEKTTPACA